MKRHSYNPVKDLIEKEPWDGVERIDDFLEKVLKCTQNSEYLREVSRMIFYGGISRVYDTQENIGIDSDLTIFPVESKDDFPDGLTTIAPIYGGGMRLGSFIIWRNDHDFIDEDLILVEIASTVVGLQLLNLQTENLEETIRKQTAINMAINTLSYSEIKAVSAILNELDGLEGRLTASVIADRIGITRSVIVNALRKLESAGIIESRSLGMKGTYLKVLNEGIYDKLKEYE